MITQERDKFRKESHDFQQRFTRSQDLIEKHRVEAKKHRLGEEKASNELKRSRELMVGGCCCVFVVCSQK